MRINGQRWLQLVTLCHKSLHRQLFLERNIPGPDWNISNLKSRKLENRNSRVEIATTKVEDLGRWKAGEIVSQSKKISRLGLPMASTPYREKRKSRISNLRESSTPL